MMPCSSIASPANRCEIPHSMEGVVTGAHHQDEMPNCFTFCRCLLKASSPADNEGGQRGSPPTVQQRPTSNDGIKMRLGVTTRSTRPHVVL